MFGLSGIVICQFSVDAREAGPFLREYGGGVDVGGVERKEERGGRGWDINK